MANDETNNPENPDSSSAIKTHRYSPSAMHQGDCNVCGHAANHPAHKTENSGDLRKEVSDG